MVVHISNNAAKAALVAILGIIDAESPTGGSLIIYSGTRPASADDAISGGNVALITFVLPNPSFGAPTDNGTGAQSAANAITAVTAAATGTASFFRLTDGAGTDVFDGAVTDTTGSGDLKLSTISVVTGIDVSVVSLNAIMPEGT